MTDRVHGEGNHEAGRKYQRETEKFTKSGRVDENAKKAARAVDDEEEGEELEQARRETKARAKEKDEASKK